jgi:N-methylhydantoinase A
MLRGLFEREYTARYGRAYSDVPVELVNLRVVVSLARGAPFRPALLREATGPVSAAMKATRRAYFGKRTGFVDCPVFDRYRLEAGHRAAGPAFVEERETTTVIGANATFEVDRYGVLTIERQG